MAIAAKISGNNVLKDNFRVFENNNKSEQDLQAIRSVVEKQLSSTGIKGALCTQDVANEIKNKITSHIIEVAKEYGFDIPAIDVTASYSEVRFNIVASTVGITGLDCFHTAYLENCQTYNLKPEWLGQSFVFDNVLFTVDGLDDSRDVTFIRLIKIVNQTTSRIKLPIKTDTHIKIGDAIGSYKKAMAISFKSK
jgi:hypothetical protein